MNRPKLTELQECVFSKSSKVKIKPNLRDWQDSHESRCCNLVGAGQKTGRIPTRLTSRHYVLAYPTSNDAGYAEVGNRHRAVIEEDRS